MKLFRLIILISIIFISLSIKATEEHCNIDNSGDFTDGYVRVSKDRKLYWRKYPSVQKRIGTVFFLAGGPLPHWIYNEAVKVYRQWLPHYDLVTYDYYGMNCSEKIQSISMLEQSIGFFRIESIAKDFNELKEFHIGKEKAVILGGSFGALLGAQIIKDYPESIKKAILYSGDTKSGWLEKGWDRFDQILKEMSVRNKNFSDNYRGLIAALKDSKVKINDQGKEIIVTKEMFEVALFMNFLPSSVAQASLPHLLTLSNSGDFSWIQGIVQGNFALLNDVFLEESPTHRSILTNFYRCNVWYPKDRRQSNKVDPGFFLSKTSFINFWNQLCKDYDSMGSFPQDSKPKIITNVPTLVWVGDRDYFDPQSSQSRWAQLTTRLEFHIMSGWAHDFGVDDQAGLNVLEALVKDFISQQ